MELIINNIKKQTKEDICLFKITSTHRHDIEDCERCSGYDYDKCEYLNFTFELAMKILSMKGERDTIAEYKQYFREYWSNKQ